VTDAARRWLAAAGEILDGVARQHAAIEEASRLCADAIAGDGVVHLFGTGHSRIPVEEMFPRYGSYPGFHPIVELSMTFHTQVVGANGQRQAMFIERISGLADRILANFDAGPPDAMIVFSASGRTAVPLEMAAGARERGVKVIAVTNTAAGSGLVGLADVLLDIGTPPADAMVSLDGLDVPVGPGSTVANIAFVNAIKSRTAELLVQRGAMPPVITSAAVVGPERADELFEEAYLEYARRLRKVLRSS
jgi:uncharacterized phosphosugar-binding protein